MERVRREGGGRKPQSEKDPAVVKELERLVDPATRGDPMSPLRWTSKSTAKLAEELRHRGFAISARTVGSLLHGLGYSLQSNRKTRDGITHPERDAQFQHISQQTQAFQQRGAPVVSVDTKKKELVGDFKNGGREWQPKGAPEQVRMHDFPDKELGKAIPYGVYDVTGNEGWVSVGTDHDTAEFAMETIRRWWLKINATRFLIYSFNPHVISASQGGVIADCRLGNLREWPQDCRGVVARLLRSGSLQEATNRKIRCRRI